MKEKMVLFLTKCITGLFYLMLMIMVFFVASSKVTGEPPQVFGYQIKTVLSGSMEPGIQTGSIIVVKGARDLKSFKENDIVTYKVNRHQLVTHRIIEVISQNNQMMYRTKGDANDGPDTALLLPQNIVAKYEGVTVPYIGYLIEFSQSKNGIFLLFFLPGLFLLSQSLYQVARLIIEENKKSIKESHAG
ncbi:signal peptidase I [Jeotgalibacillus sp. ET6]|uniref:signal peptidase I SipW n=1 Tax=Jeotgalibacillus sp. ET6 TaxID=3037260 RepID=UPI0024188ECB|nr:signal peptidase I [Jeotgalibacillus sp. ET6]MDG5473227.1 signal peptidase I [Jeotgalibacillus sp. ET6]